MARVSRNLEKNLPEAPQAPKFFEICHSPFHLPPRGTHSTHVPDKLGTEFFIWPPVLAPGHYRWTQTVPDLNCLAIFGPRPPQPRRAARRARSSGPTLVPSPAAPAPRSLSVFRHAGSAAHDGQASRLTHPWCRIEHVVPEEVAQVAVVVVVFPVVVLCRGEHRSQWARLSRARRQIKHHKASSSRHCSPSVNESGEQGVG